MRGRTKRLILRPWQEIDLEPFAQLNADPRFREYFPQILSCEESDASVKLMSNHIEKCSWGFWAVSLIETGELIGMIGLEGVYFTAHFTTTVEIGWREHLIDPIALHIQQAKETVKNKKFKLTRYSVVDARQYDQEAYRVGGSLFVAGITRLVSFMDAMHKKGFSS